MKIRRLIRVVCSEGKTQSLRHIDLHEDAEVAFERYKTRLRWVRDSHNGANPGLTDEWIDTLTYKVEVN